MVHINRIEASRNSAAWGKEEDTHEKAMKACLSGGNPTMADSGTLLRVADALERIADLMDPEVRAEKRKEDEQQRKWNQEDDERKATAKAAEECLWLRFNEWKERNADQLDRLPGLLRRKLLSGIAKPLRKYPHDGYASYREHFEALISGDVLCALEREPCGIGPIYRKRIEEALTSLPNESEDNHENP